LIYEINHYNDETFVISDLQSVSALHIYMVKKTFTTTVGGKEMTAEFNDLAEQANGSVMLRYGKTVVLATACMSTKERNDIDYFPLMVDYEEKYYAAGQILGSRFMRREGRPSEEAVLSGRVVDRTIRPLFDHNMRNEVQVVITILSIDQDDPDVMGVIAASLALGVSDIPWNGPVSAVRIGRKADGEMIVNPTYLDREHNEYRYDLLACGKEGTLNMIELGAHEVADEEIADAFEKALEIHKTLEAWQKSIVAEMAKTKRAIATPEPLPDMVALFETNIAPNMTAHVFSGKAGYSEINLLQAEWKALVTEKLPEVPIKRALDLFDEKFDDCIQRGAVLDGKRADGRAMDAVRPLYAQAGGISEMLHGSGIFYRGGTHVFTALTLGGPGDSQIVDTIEYSDVQRRFMHHYNFPPFSSGETGRLGGMNRRAIGHGALAQKALEPVLPSKDVFPYTIRLVSECMASNGSTSQGAICASTLALMDGGVPITRPVAGIAMGLMLADGKHQVMTDIQGPEDSHGHMDFKVAGTREGVTAIQMDIKLDGVPVPVLVEALAGAKKARLEILDVIEKEIPAPRPDISPLAPKILTMRVKVDQIGLVIGGGGKTINGIKDATGVDDITIEDDGSIFITGKNGSAEKALAMIQDLVKEWVPGEMVEGEVTRIMDFGAFVKIGANAEGMVHVSEIAPFRIDRIRDALTEGERVKVVVKEIDDRGRINLSIKRADPQWAQRKGLGGGAPPARQ
jgi:polyribonucleotide nucleotidyltransferase